MRQTPMAEFVLDTERLIVPGTEDPDAEEDGCGQVRRGLIDDYWGTLGHRAGGFTLVDSAGKYLMTGDYCRPELREPLFKALRDLLDMVDPLPAAPAR
jgi:hypothetical protein